MPGDVIPGADSPLVDIVELKRKSLPELHACTESVTTIPMMIREKNTAVAMHNLRRYSTVAAMNLSPEKNATPWPSAGAQLPR